MTLRGGSPTIRPEAASALGAGMSLKKARLYLARGPREWHFTLDGETLDLSGLKVPQLDEDVIEGEAKEPKSPDEVEAGEKKPKPKKDDGLSPEDELVLKLEAAEEAREVVMGLYKQFLVVRLARDWNKIEMPRLRDWVKKKLELSAHEVGVN
jgi:hypothetical protein